MGRSQIYRQAEEWKRRNPWYLVNVSIIGQSCGRASTLEAAKAEANRLGKFVGVDGYAVLFSSPVYC